MSVKQTKLAELKRAQEELERETAADGFIVAYDGMA